MNEKFANFREFYVFYLSEHSNARSRRLHFVGTACVLALIFASLVTGRWRFLWLMPIVGYGFAWVAITTRSGTFAAAQKRPN